MNPIVFKVLMLFTPSPIMNEMRKKAGSDVFSKNHYGGFVRKRVKGTNPHTPKQINVRAFLTSLSKAWKALTQNQRDGWNQYGTSILLKNRLGQSIHLTGEAWYLKLNRILQTIGSTVIGDAPAGSAVPPDLADTPVLTCTSGSAIGLTLGNAVSSENKLMVKMSPPLSPGKNYNSNYRFLGIVVAADTTTKDFTAAYLAAFGKLPETGDKVFMLVRSTDKTTGLQNQSQSVSKTI